MRRARRRVGLLGGSFNPAHQGHVHLSLAALKRLQLDEVWWLVSPQNPLKSRTDTADYATRVTLAGDITRDHPPIHILTIEHERGWYYSIDTIKGLQASFPALQFVWLMGADNLAHFHRWRAWEQIANLLPIAVFDRAPFTLHSLRSRFALRFRQHRLSEGAAPRLADSAAPSWVYIHMRRNPLSSTALRKTLGIRAFLRHTTREQ